MSKTIDDLMNELHVLLADRLPLSRSWNNVSVKNSKRKYEIKWFDSNEHDDPKGKFAFSSHGGPYTIDGLEEEIVAQKKKLRSDKGNV